MQTSLNAAHSFHQTAQRHPDAPAIVTAQAAITYGSLADRAARLAAVLKARRRSGRVGILATRSIEAYLGIVATAWSGGTYVPLNLKWPEARLVELLGALQLDALIVDENGAALLSDGVRAAAPELVLQPADLDRLTDEGAERLDAPVAVATDHPAYIIFTSGTTGTPKGVVIASGSLQHYLDQTEGWTGFTVADRIAECCDVTFDLTVHNMFLAWRAGSALHLLSQLELMAPARFIRANRVTVWLSVPTIAGTMRRMGMLKAGMFPDLRLSIFCGEPLPVAVAQAWQAATPNGRVENIYGPTEATVICMRQTLTDPPAETAGRGILAIGKAYETMEVAILDGSQKPVRAGEAGEIALSGPQLAIGYFNAPDQTADRFRTIDGRRWYLTGDLGCQDAEGVFHHLGRVDNQIKLKGNRIELEEIDAHLRTASGADTVATVAWPITHGSAEGLVAFCAGTARDAAEIRRRLRDTLPEYMVPGDIRVLDALPLNVNGKVDRRALREGLEAAKQTGTHPAPG